MAIQVLNEDDVLDPQEIARVPKHFVVIRRSTFKLAVYERAMPRGHHYDQRVYSCRVATGMIRHRTPGGPHYILAKARHPDWTAPDEKWVYEMGRKPGDTIPGKDPHNPIRESFLKLTDGGIGIHGTTKLRSLGTEASHGCIRVKPAAAIHLYKLLDTGTPVYII